MKLKTRERERELMNKSQSARAELFLAASERIPSGSVQLVFSTSVERASQRKRTASG